MQEGDGGADRDMVLLETSMVVETEVLEEITQGKKMCKTESRII